MPKVQSFERETGGHSRRSRRTTSSLAEINVVPLVDVMLVLLIIFMVTAPMMQRGLEIQLPVARRGTPITAEPVYVTLPLSYRKDKRVAIGPLGKEEMVPISALGAEYLLAAPIVPALPDGKARVLPVGTARIETRLRRQDHGEREPEDGHRHHDLCVRWFISDVEVIGEATDTMACRKLDDPTQ